MLVFGLYSEFHLLNVLSPPDAPLTQYTFSWRARVRVTKDAYRGVMLSGV